MPFFLLIFLIPTVLLAADSDCIQELNLPGISDVITAVERPNCHLSSDFTLEAEMPGSTEICGSCRSSFISSLPNFREDDEARLMKTKKNAFVTILLKELKKTLAGLTGEVMALSSDSGNSFSRSVQACDTNKFVQGVSGCDSMKEMKNELASLPDFLSQKIASRLIPRSSSCEAVNGLSQAQISQLSVEAISMSLNANTIDQISSFTPSTEGKLRDDLINATQGDMATQGEKRLFSLFSKDPVLKSLMSNPAEFISFFSSLKNLSPSDRRNRYLELRQSPTVNKKLDQQISKDCEKLFKDFTDTVCAADFNAQSIASSPLSNYYKLNDDQTFDDQASISNTKDITENNFSMLSFCPNPDDSQKKFKLPDLLSNINNSLPPEKRNLALIPYERLENSEAEAVNTLLCSANCDNGSTSHICTLKRLLNAKKTELASNPALQNYHPSTKELLRKIAGTPSKLTTEEKQVLISQGILSQEDATAVAAVAPAQADQSKSSSASPSNSGSVANSSGGRGTQASGRDRSENQQANQSQRRFQQAPGVLPSSQIISPAFSEAFEEQLGELTNLTEQERRRFMDFQEEISRRLSQSPRGTVTREEARQAAERITREPRANFNPQRRNQFVTSYMNTFDELQNNLASTAGSSNGRGVELGNDLADQAVANRGDPMERALEEAAIARRGRGATSGIGAAVASGGSSAVNRTPAGNSDSQTLESEISVSLTAFEANPQVALSSRLPSELADNFVIEIKGRETFKYQVIRSAQGFTISLLQGPQRGRDHIRTLQMILANYSQRSGPSREDLLNVVTRAN